MYVTKPTTKVFGFRPPLVRHQLTIYSHMRLTVWDVRLLMQAAFAHSPRIPLCLLTQVAGAFGAVEIPPPFP